MRRFTISLRVEGAGFRYALADEARPRKSSGWMRNRRDGSAEALVAGSDAWAHREPPAARVTEVDVEPATEAPAGFDIARTV